MTRADLLPLLRWALRHPCEAARELFTRGTTGLVEAWEMAELAEMVAAFEAHRESERRETEQRVAAAADAIRAERVEVYIGRPLFAVRVCGERWRWN